MTQKSSSTSQQRKQLQDETFGLEEIIPAIIHSALPKGDKVAYLYMIAEGSFSLQTLEDIQREMEEANTKLREQADQQKADIAQMEQDLARMEDELDALATQSVLDHKSDLEQFIELAAEQMEQDQTTEESQEMEAIRKRLTNSDD